MKVLVGFEFSGRVRDAFIRKGHQAVSCDLTASERLGPHIQGDVFEVLEDGWELGIFHPPCTYTAVSGARWFKLPGRPEKQEQAVEDIRTLWASPIPRVAIEQPISVVSTKWRPPTQIVQPWQFGEPTTKATCLWERGVPRLHPTKIVVPTRHDVWREPPSDERQRNRSRTSEGLAEAMADQWG